MGFFERSYSIYLRMAVPMDLQVPKNLGPDLRSACHRARLFLPREAKPSELAAHVRRLRRSFRRNPVDPHYPDPWADQESRSTLGFHNLQHGGIGVQNWRFYFWDPPRGLSIWYPTARFRPTYTREYIRNGRRVPGSRGSTKRLQCLATSSC